MVIAMINNYYGTRISQNNIDNILNRHMTPAQIIDYLKHGAIFRSFRDVLWSVYGGNDLGDKLVAGLISQQDKELSSKEKDSIKRNVYYWLSGKSIPQSREQLFKICFALQLTESQANMLLAKVSEMGIHYRNPQELVFAYSLRTHKTYLEAVQLQTRMKPIYESIVEGADKERKSTWKANESFNDIEKEPIFYTQHIRDKFEGVNSDDDLEAFFVEYSTELGKLHESAYEKFRKMLAVLEKPNAGDTQYVDAKDDCYSIEKITETYFRISIPNNKSTKNYSYLQKVIKRNWLGSTELNKMRNRTIDVSRKAILLLFIVTEDFLLSIDLTYSNQRDTDAAQFILEYDESPRDQLETVIQKIKLFLETYGMNQLDPGNPFDCLILYSLAAEYDEDEYWGDQFNKALAILFEGVEDTPKKGAEKPN